MCKVLALFVFVPLSAGASGHIHVHMHNGSGVHMGGGTDAKTFEDERPAPPPVRAPAIRTRPHLRAKESGFTPVDQEADWDQREKRTVPEENAARAERPAEAFEGEALPPIHSEIRGGLHR